MAAQRPQQLKPLDVLPQTLSDVVVQIGKVFKSAGKDGKCNASIVNVVATTKIPASIEAFNSALDDIESDILRAKATLQRDLNQLRASRRQEQRVAPPAPMSIDLSSPKMTKATAPTPPMAQAPPFQSLTGSNSNPNRPVKQESKPVAPFPNMGFDLPVSPEVTPVPIPSPKTMPRPKNSPRPSMATKPTSAPVRKETKILPPQPPRPASQASPSMRKATPAGRAQANSNPPPRQTPVPVPTVPTKQTPVPIPNIPPPKQTPVPIPMPPAAAPAPAPAPAPQPITIPASAPAPISAPVSAPPAPPAAGPPPTMPPTTGAENIFTDMTFSLAPPETPGGANQQQQPEIDLVALGAGNADISSFSMSNFQGGGGGPPPAAMANMGFGGGQQDGGNKDANMSSVDEKIDTLFDLGSVGMDNIEMNYDLGDNGGDNSSFNDMFFNMNDDNMTTNQFDNAYFGLQ